MQQYNRISDGPAPPAVRLAAALGLARLAHMLCASGLGRCVNRFMPKFIGVDETTGCIDMWVDEDDSSMACHDVRCMPGEYIKSSEGVVYEKGVVYQLGALLAFVACKQASWRDIRRASGLSVIMYRQIAGDRQLELPGGGQLSLTPIIMDCTHADPARRPTMAEVVSRVSYEADGATAMFRILARPGFSTHHVAPELVWRMDGEVWIVNQSDRHCDTFVWPNNVVLHRPLPKSSACYSHVVVMQTYEAGEGLDLADGLVDEEVKG